MAVAVKHSEGFEEFQRFQETSEKFQGVSGKCQGIPEDLISKWISGGQSDFSKFLVEFEGV